MAESVPIADRLRRFVTTALARFRSDRANGKVSGKHRRVKTPTVFQMEAVECGAAALSIILGYYGRIVPLEELRVACGVSRDGTKASNILKAARNYGFTAKGYKKEIADLKDLPYPFIVFWNFNHFLVVEGISRGIYYLSDPAGGKRWVTSEEFDQSFTGVVLTFETTSEFERRGRRPSLLAALANRLRGSRASVAYVILASLLLTIPGIITPAFTRVFVDEYLVRRLDDWLSPLLLVMGIAAILKALFTYLQQDALLRLENKLAISGSGKFFWHILRLPIEFFAQRSPGEIVARIEINDRLAQLLSGDLATNAVNFVMIGFYALVMFQYDVWLTVIGIGIASVNLVMLRLVSRKRVDDNRRLLQDQGKLWGITMSGLVMIETLKSTGSETDFFNRWSGAHAKVINAQQQLGVSSQVLSSVPPVLSGLLTALILGVGGYRVMEGVLTIGMLVAFQSLMNAFADPVNKLTDLGGKIQKAQGDMYRLDDVLRYPHAKPFVARHGEDQVGRKLAGAVEFRNVSFGYSRLDPPLLKEFNLTMHPGSRVAIVGVSGSGKSTVAKLLAGLYEPWDGEILLDGESRTNLSRELINNSLSVVDQDTFLFDGSLRENLSLWDSTIPEPELIRAAKDASIHDDITARGGGYEYRIEESGRNFSGGQRQRLEIARALAIDPRILVLDEATASLDPRTELMVDDAVRRRGCTCLIIAHRLSTIRDCEEILVLERGQVVERGQHQELLQREGAYARLIRAGG